MVRREESTKPRSLREEIESLKDEISALRKEGMKIVNEMKQEDKQLRSETLAALQSIESKLEGVSVTAAAPETERAGILQIFVGRVEEYPESPIYNYKLTTSDRVIPLVLERESSRFAGKLCEVTVLYTGVGKSFNIRSIVVLPE